MIISCFLIVVWKIYTLFVQHFNSSVWHYLTKLKMCIVLDLAFPLLIICADKYSYMCAVNVKRMLTVTLVGKIKTKKPSECLSIRKYFSKTFTQCNTLQISERISQDTCTDMEVHNILLVKNTRHNERT